MNMLSVEDSLVLIIDIQEKLVNALEKDNIVRNSQKVASAARILDIPVILTEQYPKGLGNTLESLKNVLPENTCILEKTAFNALLRKGLMFM